MIIFKNDWRYELDEVSYTEAVQPCLVGDPDGWDEGEAAEIDFNVVSITRDDPKASKHSILDYHLLREFALESYESGDYI